MRVVREENKEQKNKLVKDSKIESKNKKPVSWDQQCIYHKAGITFF